MRNTPFYVVMGVTTGGEREILGIWARDGGEGARFWRQLFSELKSRGVEDVLIAVCDGLKGLPEAITTTGERTVVQIQGAVVFTRNMGGVERGGQCSHLQFGQRLHAGVGCSGRPA